LPEQPVTASATAATMPTVTIARFVNVDEKFIRHLYFLVERKGNAAQTCSTFIALRQV
jgi:hypothetical protein